jgi:hypothetical protein
VLGQTLADQLHNTLHRRFDLPPGGMFGGWHMYMSKDLRTLLGRPVRGPLRNRYCGGGDVNVCRADLWAAMEAAGTEMAAVQGPDPNGWTADVRSGPAALHDALHQPPERDPAGDRVQGAPLGR